MTYSVVAATRLRACFLGLWASLALTIAIVPCEARAQTSDAAQSEGARAESDEADASAYSRYYNGAFVEYAVRGGASLASQTSYGGWHVDAGVRQSFPMMIGDFRVAYRYDHLGEQGPAGPGPIEQHGLGGYLAVHPAYLLLLGSDWLSYTLASIYAELGAGVQFGVLERRNEDVYETNFGPFVSLGAGIDIPLGDPDEGYAPWLNLVYRWHVADFDDNIETYDLDMHLLQIGLGWRINGLLF